MRNARWLAALAALTLAGTALAQDQGTLDLSQLLSGGVSGLLLALLAGFLLLRFLLPIF